MTIDAEKMGKVVKEIYQVLESNELKMSEGSACLGAVLAFIAIKTEENFPLISFLNSFTRSYSYNYSGEEIHEVAKTKPLKDL